MSNSHASLYKLMTWLSPSYPVGGYSYSQGLETAIDYQLVTDKKTLNEWIGMSLMSGPIWVDAVIFSQAYQSLDKDDDYALQSVNDYALALQNTQELKKETLALGRSFVKVTQSAWDLEAAKALPPNAVYPLAVAYCAHEHGIDIEVSLLAWLHAACSAQVSTAQRLGVLGQSDAQILLSEMFGQVETVTAKALSTKLEQVSTSTILLEICSMNHETQSTRIFQS